MGKERLSVAHHEEYREVSGNSPPHFQGFRHAEIVGCSRGVLWAGEMRGTPIEAPETNAERYDHAMKQLIQRVNWELPDGENLLMVLDKQCEKERVEIFAGAAAFMFSSEDATKLVETPMEVESHLYQTVQCADWICAILGRIAAYKYDSNFAEYKWALKYFGDRLSAITSEHSKIRAASSATKDLYPKFLGNYATCY